MSEFTGERVIPGQVEVDLWNEHFSRYRFAARFAAGKRVLDLGCGTGYGSAELARTAKSVIGVDVSAEAIQYAVEHYKSPELSFERHSCTQLPWPGGGYEVVVAFELIEHLESYDALLREAKRMLAPEGVFIVSTPNKDYYAEQRKLAGPNPFHAREFEYQEFRAALEQCFPRVNLLFENRSEAFVFAPGSGAVAAELANTQPDPSDAHFFVAVCSCDGSVDTQPFAYLPSAGNVLRERERHIERLHGELQLKDEWLGQTTAERNQLHALQQETTAELEVRNRWALALEAELSEARQRVEQLQQELSREQQAGRETATAYERKIAELERDIIDKTAWAMNTEERLASELDAKSKELAEAVHLLDRAEATMEERTRWALALDEQLRVASTKLDRIRGSRWVKLGRVARLGPDLS